MSSRYRLQSLLIWPCSGAGVGGLTLAYALSQADDIRIDVYEAAGQLAEIGAGIGLFWRSQRVLTELGLKDAVTALGSEFRDGYGA